MKQIEELDAEIGKINAEIAGFKKPAARAHRSTSGLLFIIVAMLLLATVILSYNRISGFAVIGENATGNTSENAAENHTSQADESMESATETIITPIITQENTSAEENITTAAFIPENVTENAPLAEITEEISASATVLGIGPRVMLRDRKGERRMQQSEAVNETAGNLEVTITSPIKAVKRVRLHGVRPSAELDIGLEEIPVEGTEMEQMYAVDLSNANFSNGTLTAVAAGTELYKCKEWNFSEQQCYGNWTKVMDLVPGEEYNITLTPEDPAYFETRQPSQTDSYADQQNPTTNYGTSTEIDVQARNNRARRTFVTFNTSGIPANAIITSANISLYKYGGSTSSRTYNSYRVTASWAEGTINWNNQPAVAGTATSSTTVSSTNTWYKWDVTNDVRGMLNGSYTNYGWRISDSSEGGGAVITSQFYSREYAANTSRRPKIEISYIIDTAPNTTLSSPSNGSTNTSQDINFTCNATDDFKLSNITLYWNYTGTWQANGTNSVSGTTNGTGFFRTALNNRLIMWNCRACDNKSNCTSAIANWTVNISHNAPPLMNTSFPANNSLDPDGNVTFNCSATDDLSLVNISLYINNALNKTASVSGTYNQSASNMELANGVYTWYCYARDSAGSANMTGNYTLTVNRSSAPNSTSFTGQTTNWTILPDLSHVCNGTALLEKPSDGAIQWWGCVNASYQNFDSNVNLSSNFAAVNFGLNPTFNSTATITIRGLAWDSLPDILMDGALCDLAVCQNATYNDTTGVLIFNTTHFTNFSTVGNSRLGVWDQNDTGMPKGNRNACIGTRTEFFANYSRTSNSNPITAATCVINFTDSTGNTMTYNTTSLYYEYNRTFSTPGVKMYNATCSRTGFQRISLSDSINMTDCTPPTVTLVRPPNGNITTDRDFNFTCNATDNMQLGNITFYWNYTGTWQANGTQPSTGTANETNFSRTNLSMKTTYWNCYACDNSSLCAYSAANSTLTITSFAPTVNITSPANNTNFAQGQDITFTGNAYDQHDGNLSGSSMVWTSSIDGRIGDDTEAVVATLTPGIHNITLNATNSDGLSAKSMISITVSPDTCPGSEAGAFTLVNITVDGNMTDWDPVLENTYNYITDGAGGINDLDNVTSVELDLRKYSVTWNNETLWMHVRRNGLGQTLMKAAIYLDVNEDELLNSPDTAVFVPWYGPWGLYIVFAYNYTPVNVTGDRITGDGETEPGGRTAARIVTLGIGGATNGIELESGLTWDSLNLPSCSPLVGHVSSTQGLISDIPTDVVDNMMMLDTRLYRIKFYPDSIKSGKQGSTVTHKHTLRNIGNVRDLYNINTAGTTPGYNTVLYYANGTLLSDTDGDGRIDTGYIRPSYGVTIYMNITIPLSATSGDIDTTTITANSKRNNLTNASVTDITVVGAVAVIPNRNGFATNASTIEYNHTIYNNDLTSTINVNASSSNGYPVNLFYNNGTHLTDTNSDGLQDIGKIAKGSSSILKVRIAIPSSATLGSTDNTTIQASSIYGQSGRAYDSTVVAQVLTIVPNITKAAGQGKSTYLIHNITYVSNTSGVVDLTYNQTQAYTLQLYGADMITPLIDTNGNGIIDAGTFGPNGQTKTIAAKLAIPITAAVNTTDIIFYNISSTITPRKNTAKDNVTVQKLVTYKDAGFNLQSYYFTQTERVYAEGYSLAAANVYFQYIDPNGTVARLSPAVLVDSSRRADDYYLTNASDLSGAWTLVLYDTNGTIEIVRIPFYLNIPPVVISANATPDHAYQGDIVNFTANVTSGEQRWLINETVVMGALLEIAGKNHSMTGPNTTSGIGEYYLDTLNTSNLTSGTYTYKIYAYDNFTFNNVSVPYVGTLVIYPSNSSNVTGILTDSRHNAVNAAIYVYNSTGNLVWTDDQNYSFVLDRADRYNITIIPASGAIKEITYINITFPVVLINFTRLEDSLENETDKPDEIKNWTEAISWWTSTQFNYAKAKINFTYGAGTGLYFWKCAGWNFDSRSCSNNNFTIIQNLSNGPNWAVLYLSPGDPGAGAGKKPAYNESLRVWDVTGLNSSGRRYDGTLVGEYHDLDDANFTIAKSYRIETVVTQTNPDAVGIIHDPYYDNIQDDWLVDMAGIDSPNITQINGTLTINTFTPTQSAGTEAGTSLLTWDADPPHRAVEDMDANETASFWFVVDIPLNASSESHQGHFLGDSKGENAEITNNLTTITGKPPCKVNLTFPNNGNNTLINRTQTLIWQQACDPDNQTLTYSINITSQYCPDIYGTNITATNYTPVYELGTYDECGTYNWSVRAYDGYYYGNHSDTWNFSIMPYLALSFLTDTIDFGEADNDETNDTTDNNPLPLVMQNDGNVFADVVNASRNQSFFTGASAAESDFQIMAANTTETESFNWTGSATYWINLTTLQTIISRFNWHDTNDTAKIEAKVHVPLDEPSGTKITGLVFYGEQT